ncbi:MAG: hypothetical protein ACRCUY_00020 [Thermoguttaceae bacterium]
MKKMLALVFVFAFALVVCGTSFAQEAALLIEQNNNAVPVNAQESLQIDGMQDFCGPVMPYAPCRPFIRKPCLPCYSNPCAPQPACPPVAANCGSPCGNFYGGYPSVSPCGVPPYGYYRTPIRNFLGNLFAPRAYYGYDAMYGPSGYGYGYGYGGYAGYGY